MRMHLKLSNIFWKKFKVTYFSSPQLLLEVKFISLSPCIIFENRYVVLAHLAMFIFNLSFFIYFLWINRFWFFSNVNSILTLFSLFSRSKWFVLNLLSLIYMCDRKSRGFFFLVANDRSGIDSSEPLQQKDRFAICWMYNDLYKCAIIATF